MARKMSMRSAAAGLALVMALGSAAQAAPAMSGSASTAIQTATEARDGNFVDVRSRYRRYNNYRNYRNGAIGAGIALGTLGLIAGAAAANNRYNCDPYYEYCGQPRRRYYEPRYYYPPPPPRYYYRY